MRFRGPKTLHGLILLGLGLVATPLLIATTWAVIHLDRLAERSEILVGTSIETTNLTRLLDQQTGSLERSARQHAVLQNENSLSLVEQDLVSTTETLDNMRAIAQQAGISDSIDIIEQDAGNIVASFKNNALAADDIRQTLQRFTALRQHVRSLAQSLESFVNAELATLQSETQRAQQISAWQTAALIPGTIILVGIFTLLVARPLRQIDQAIDQLGNSGFSKAISVSGPRDLQKLGRQLEWLRARLLGLAQEKNRFLRHMSHELKTPLANIREGTELLLDGSVGELQQGQREVTDILRLNGLKLQQLIENLLSFSAWQSKNEVLSLSKFPLRALVLSVAKAQRLALKAAQIQIVLDIDDFVVSIDREKFKTVIDNLLSNAIKFTPKEGTITIRAKAEESAFTLEFADTGPGITDNESTRVFEAFFQGEQKQGGHLAGTGIGLSVVQECVQAHNGTVELMSTQEFPGAHFKIRIPQQWATTQERVAANA